MTLSPRAEDDGGGGWFVDRGGVVAVSSPSPAAPAAPSATSSAPTTPYLPSPPRLRRRRPTSLVVNCALLTVALGTLTASHLAQRAPAGASYAGGGSFRRLIESSTASSESSIARAESPSSQPQQQRQQQRRQGCVSRAVPKEVRPVIAASYPGSGAKMTWKLLRGMTGIMTGDDHDHNGLVSARRVVSVKTHYPAIDTDDATRVFKRVEDADRVLLLLRHPMAAIPSYHNFEYERKHDLPNHSTRAPVYEWERWRDERFRSELEAWERHVRYWVERVPHERRLIVTFERLSGREGGGMAMEEMGRIGTFLRDGDDRIDVVPEDRLRCVWETIAADRRVGFEGERRHSLRKGPAVAYPFTDEQLDRMDSVLGELAVWRPGQLGPVMGTYRDMIGEARRSGAAAAAAARGTAGGAGAGVASLGDGAAAAAEGA